MAADAKANKWQHALMTRTPVEPPAGDMPGKKVASPNSTTNYSRSVGEGGGKAARTERLAKPRTKEGGNIHEAGVTSFARRCHREPTMPGARGPVSAEWGAKCRANYTSSPRKCSRPRPGAARGILLEGQQRMQRFKRAL
eukprot:6112649-Alexandrium_andersonii.AAC.1